MIGAQPPVLQFVYAYTYESDRSDVADKAYGVDKMDPGGGGTFVFHNVNQHFIAPSVAGPQSRSGTIAVELVHQESDGGMVVNVSELPGGAPDTCVVFGDTTVVCDPAHEVSAEARALLALLGKDFVDPLRIDASRHWRIASQGPNGSVDYTIVRSAQTLLEIDATGVRTQPGDPSKTTIEAKIEYDAVRSLPVSVYESTIERSRHGAIDEAITTHVSLKLLPETAAIR